MKGMEIEHVVRSLIVFMVVMIIGCSHRPPTPPVTPTAKPTAILSWNAPTTNVDGSPVTDLKGYKVYVGDAPGRYERTIDVGNQTSFTLRHLRHGATYFFAVTAYDSTGLESTFSNEVSKSFPAVPGMNE